MSGFSGTVWVGNVSQQSSQLRKSLSLLAHLIQPRFVSSHPQNKHWGHISYKKCTWVQIAQACHIMHLSQSWNWILSQVGRRVPGCHTKRVDFRALTWERKWFWGRQVPVWPPLCLLATVAAIQAVRRWPHSKYGWVEACPRLQPCLFLCDQYHQPKARGDKRRWEVTAKTGRIPGSWSLGLQL